MSDLFDGRHGRGNERRAEILDVILAYQQEHGMSPVIGEIATSMSCARSTIWHHLTILRDHGYVAIEPGRMRSLRILRSWENAA